MADHELPTDYDAIILGTGMTECIIAAALSRIGWKVLHLDRYDYYSGDWATFHFEGLLGWIQHHQDTSKASSIKVKEVPLCDILQDDESSLPLSVNSTNISNVKDFIYIRDTAENDTEMDKNEEEISKKEKCVKVSTKDTVESGERETSQTLPQDNINASNYTEQIPASDSNAPETENENDENATKQATAVNNAEQKACGDTCDFATENNENATEVATETTDSEQTSAVENRPVETTGPKQWTFQEIKKNWRKFNIDLAPRILYCRGPMVDLLISSDIAKYCEFRTITRVLTQLNGKLEQVPCSRSDVFSSKQVSVIEKRMLMKLLTFAIEFEKHPEEYAGYEDKPFREFLQSKKLSSNVQHYVYTAIAMATESTSTLEGLRATQSFIQSLGRYGNTAFLWPLYGSGELPQCFCRMCAVFGGVYCLRRTGANLLINSENKCKGIIDTEGQRLNAKYVIMEASFASEKIVPELFTNKKSISRGVLLTDRTILPSNKEHISLLCLPPTNGQDSYVNIYELSYQSCACPKDIYVVQLSCRGVLGAEQDLSSAIDMLFHKPSSEGDRSEEKPNILWSMFYDQADTSDLKLAEDAPEGLFVVPGPDLALDLDQPIKLSGPLCKVESQGWARNCPVCVKFHKKIVKMVNKVKARDIFDKLCPGEEFLPKAPNPDDIIFDDGTEPADQGSGFESSDVENNQPKSTEASSESRNDGDEHS